MKTIVILIIVISILLLSLLIVMFTRKEVEQRSNYVEGYKLVIVAHPDDETIWAEPILGKNTRVLVVTNGSKEERREELAKIMNITGSKWQIWDYPDDDMTPFNEKEYEKLVEDLTTFLQQFPYIDAIYTHNEEGEYGHPQHKQVHQAVKKAYFSVYKNGNAPKFYVFSPDMEGPRKIGRYQKLLDIYDAQGVE